MAKAREIPGLSAQEPYAIAAARILAVRSQELADHSGDVLDLGDIERVHDMRVATRRLRAALEVFEPCFPRKAHGAALAGVKELADALGERRDRDVTIDALERFGRGLSARDRPGVRSLVDRIRGEQLQANEGLAPYVAAERLAGLRAQLDDLVEAARETVERPATSAEAIGPSGENGSGSPANGAKGPHGDGQ